MTKFEAHFYIRNQDDPAIGRMVRLTSPGLPRLLTGRNDVIVTPISAEELRSSLLHEVIGVEDIRTVPNILVLLFHARQVKKGKV